jgi:hypothetical protein
MGGVFGGWPWWLRETGNGLVGPGNLSSECAALMSEVRGAVAWRRAWHAWCDDVGRRHLKRHQLRSAAAFCFSTAARRAMVAWRRFAHVQIALKLWLADRKVCSHQQKGKGGCAPS